MIKSCALSVLLIITTLAAYAQVSPQSPEQFLGYQLGQRFTLHHEVVDYFEHLAGASKQVTLTSYGKTYEHRPLLLAFITSEANQAQLETIRTDNLKRAGILEGNPTTNIPVIWLSYNVHGNEASATEAALATIYELVKQNSQYAAWLDKAVIVIDPCINPDGRDRYAHWYRQVGHLTPNPGLQGEEHHEHWRPGRSNHYLFDLNRDWAWQEQIESQSRIKIYNQWLPHIHVDFHEQFVNNPYYFAPAAEPFHEYITDWQRKFQVTIGKNNAKYFDQSGWLYFTKESFDLLYPSYGDTYPTFNGSIGMTYEQAGHGLAGLAAQMDNGDTLTLLDRLTHHTRTGLATIESGVQNADQMLKAFGEYFSTSVTNPPGKFKTYIIKSSNGPDKLNKLTQWLTTHGIKYGTAGSSRSGKGFSYRQGNKNASFRISANDLIISAHQPKGILAQILLDPETKLTDSATYDITAWSLPYAYDLDAYATTEKIQPKGQYQLQVHDASKYTNTSAYAYAIPWGDILDTKFLSKTIQAGIKARFAGAGFTAEGKRFNAGTIVITAADNRKHQADWRKQLLALAKEYNRDIMALTTGFSDAGPDLGSASFSLIDQPKVAVLAGNGVSSLSYGEVWHYFEQQIQYPFTTIKTDMFTDVDLSRYNVMVVPEGNYSTMNEDAQQALDKWVAQGNKLIVIGGAVNLFAEREGYGLTYKKGDDKKKEDPKPVERKLYKNRVGEFLQNYTAGSIYKISLDNSHPLAFGYRTEHFNLRLNNAHYAYLSSGWNVGVIENKKALISGYTGAKALDKIDNTLVYGVQRVKGGQVVYLAENPLFRSFWYSGKQIMSNAIFLVGN